MNNIFGFILPLVIAFVSLLSIMHTVKRGSRVIVVFILGLTLIALCVVSYLKL